MTDEQKCEAWECDLAAVTKHADGIGEEWWLCEEHGDALGFMNLRIKPRGVNDDR